MTFRRFDRLFKAQASNPEYPLNNAESLARLPAAERRLLADRVALVARKRGDCAAWAEAVDNATASATAYRAAFEAAEAGDIRAGTCFAMGLWPGPEQTNGPPSQHPSAAAARFAAGYRQQAPRFLARAIAAGYWPALIVADNAGRAEHGTRIGSPRSPRDAYVFKRLLQRGIGDAALADAYDAEATRLASAWSAAERAQADADAAQRFDTTFRARPMTEAERYENCGN